MKPRVAILLATYNGAAYLPELLAGLRRQTWSDYRLIVRDDGSVDATRMIIAEAAEDDDRFQVLDDAAERFGPAQNFGRLLQTAYDGGADYALFADQDDVWFDDKTARLLQAAVAAGRDSGPDCPVLVHSDLIVVDERLRLRHPSLKRFAGQRSDASDPRRSLLAANHVTGCATLVNRALMRIALPFPRQIVMHDWWVAQCAATAGTIRYLPEPTMQYRLHSGNTLGLPSLSEKLNVLRREVRTDWRRRVDETALAIDQVRALKSRLEQLTSATTDESLAIVNAFLAAIDGKQTAWRKLAALRNAGMLHIGFLRQAAFGAKLWALDRRKVA